MTICSDCFREPSTSLGLLSQMPVVAAEKFRVCRPKGSSMSDDHQLYLTLVNVDHHTGGPFCVHEEDDSEDCHLKLWARSDEGAANGFNQPMPAELEVQNMIVMIRLWTKRKIKTLNMCIGHYTGT